MSQWKTQTKTPNNSNFKMSSDRNLFAVLGNNLFEAKEVEAVEKVKNYIRENPSLYPIREYHSLKGETRKSPMGTLVSFKVYQKNIPVMGMQLDFRVNNQGRVSEVFSSYKPIAEVVLERNSNRSVDEILKLHEEDYISAAFGTTQASSIIWVEPVSFQAHLGYVIPVISNRNNSKVPERAIFSVTTGQLLARELSRSEFDSLKRP